MNIFPQIPWQVTAIVWASLVALIFILGLKVLKMGLKSKNKIFNENINRLISNILFQWVLFSFVVIVTIIRAIIGDSQGWQLSVVAGISLIGIFYLLVKGLNKFSPDVDKHPRIWFLSCIYSLISFAALFSF